jgi:hypothetical protein
MCTSGRNPCRILVDIEASEYYALHCTSSGNRGRRHEMRTARNQIRWVVLLIAVPFILTGCGTVQSHITSKPPGAKVYCNGNYVGDTPLTLPIKDGLGQDAYTITVQAEGFEPKSVELREQRFTRFDLPSKWIPSQLEFVLDPVKKAAE